jgi:hypothetical protein
MKIINEDYAGRGGLDRVLMEIRRGSSASGKMPASTSFLAEKTEVKVIREGREGGRRGVDFGPGPECNRDCTCHRDCGCDCHACYGHDDCKDFR